MPTNPSAGAAGLAAAQEVDARQRWWEVLQWVWANKDPLNTADPLIAQRVLEALEGLAVTKPRAVIRAAVSLAVVEEQDIAATPEKGEGDG